MTKKCLKLMTGLKMKRISVDYFETETAEMRNGKVYMDGVRARGRGIAVMKECRQ